MTTSLDELAPANVGERLRIAREGAGITQADAASSIKVARTTFVAIEQGQRRIWIGELQRLAKLYGTSVNALLRQEAVYVDLAPRFRKLVNCSDNAVDTAAQLLSDLAKAEVELEKSLGLGELRIIRRNALFFAETSAPKQSRMPPNYGNESVSA